jgi:hypothetical protein
VYPLVARRARHRCEYCHAPEVIATYPFEVEHIRPRAAGGGDEPDNLALACRYCNLAKGTQLGRLDRRTRRIVPLFDPRRQRWEDHFRWSRSYRSILGRTDVGRATVDALQMNAPFRRAARVYWRRLDLIP